MIRIATLCAVAAAASVSAQTQPPSNTSISVAGCVAQAQRDGSLAPKATGTQATPETAAIEANNPEPTGRFQLLDATPVATPASADPAAKPERTSYALLGDEKEFAKHVGHRVQISGTLQSPLAAKLPPKAAATAEGVRAVRVTSLKMIGTNCSVSDPEKTPDPRR